MKISFCPRFLGKTLTVIGLVLDAKYRKNHSMVEEEEEEDDEDTASDKSDDSDDDTARGYKKSYNNNGIFTLNALLNDLIGCKCSAN